MFLLLAELSAAPATADEVERILKGLVAVAHAEPGNIVYAVHRASDSRERFVLYELYRDRAACDAHLASEPVRQALKRFETLLAAPPRIVFCDTLAVAGIG